MLAAIGLRGASSAARARTGAPRASAACWCWASATARWCSPKSWVPSGMACLIITISPFWMVGAEALLPGGEPLHLPTILGMLVGLGGAALLFAPDVHTHAFHASLLSGFLVLQLGMAGWAFGSIYQRRQAGQRASHRHRRGAATGRGPVLPAVRAAFPRASSPLEPARRGRASLPGDLRLHRRVQRLHLTRWTACRWRLFRSIHM